MDDKRIKLGHPSYVWREGQERRFNLILRYAPVSGKRVLDVGCGIGLYLRKFEESGALPYGVDIDEENIVAASEELRNLAVASAEFLPFRQEAFDVVLLHEVLEHVADDRMAVAEAIRVLRRGGKAVVFVPNRLYPFETHGFFLGRRYFFGNIPLINYLPNFLRRRLCPHVRAYTSAGLRKLFEGHPVRFLVHTCIYPGYDKIALRRPRLARWLRHITYALEGSPLRIFGLSHFLVVEKLKGPETFPEAPGPGHRRS